MVETCGIPFERKFLAPQYWASWAGLGFFFIVAQFPTRLRHCLGSQFGRLIYRLNAKRRAIVLTNLEQCFPDLSASQIKRLAQQQLEWHGKALIDYSRFFFGGKKRLAQQLTLQGNEHINEAIKQQRNVIILLAHSVWLEFGPAALGLQYTCYGSYKPSRNPLFDWMIARSRCRHVESVISRDAGMLKLVRSLEPGKLMIFLPDEDLGLSHSVFVPFFGVDKATLTTPARIAKMADAVCLPAFVHFDLECGQYQLTVAPPLDLQPNADAKTQASRMNQALEALIRKHPGQYMWTLKLFKTRPDGDPAFYSNSTKVKPD